MLGRCLRYVALLAALPIAAAMLTTLSTAHAQSWGICTKETLSPDERLAACSRVIGFGITPQFNATIHYSAYFACAHLYADKKKYDEALRDYEVFLKETLREGSNLSLFARDAYRGRAVVHLNRGAYDTAIGDLDSCDQFLIKTWPIYFRPIRFGAPPRLAETAGDIPGNIVDAALRGEIAMAKKQFLLAAQYFDAYAKVYPDSKIDYRQKSELAKRLAENKSSPPTTQPPSSI